MKTAEEIVEDLCRGIHSCPPDTVILDVVNLMVKHQVYGVLVREDEKFVGIWTERDLLRNTILPGFDPKTSIVGDYMCSPLITAPHTDTVFQLIDKFLGHHIRHLLIERNGEYICLLYARDVIRAGLTETTTRYKELLDMVRFDFYEDWKWGKQHKK